MALSTAHTPHSTHVFTWTLEHIYGPMPPVRWRPRCVQVCLLPHLQSNSLMCECFNVGVSTGAAGVHKSFPVSRHPTSWCVDISVTVVQRRRSLILPIQIFFPLRCNDRMWELIGSHWTAYFQLFAADESQQSLFPLSRADPLQVFVFSQHSLYEL